MPETRTYTANNGTTVESSLTLKEAIAICKQRQDDFSKDLATKAEKFGATPQQEAWLHIKAIDFQSRQAAIAKAPVVNVVGIIQLLNRAKQSGLKHPGIRLAKSKTQALKLTIAGDTAKVPGSINVKAHHGLGDHWYGRVQPDGTLDLRRDTPPWVAELLIEFAKDPVSVAQQYGRLTDSCSFCGQGLTDDRSTKVGYGPICADRYGLPWGNEKTQIPDADAGEPESKRDRDFRYSTGQ